MPAIRTPGSGAVSDRDLEVLKSRLPTITDDRETIAWKIRYLRNLMKKDTVTREDVLG